MPSLTTFMSLTTWPSPTDFFDPDALVDNFVALDGHDHSAGKGVQIGSGGLASNAVTTPKIQDGQVTNSKLASPATDVYRDLATEVALWTNQLATGTVFFPTMGGAFQSSGTNIVTEPPRTHHLNQAWHSVPNLSPRLRILASTQTINVASSATFSIGLYPISNATGGGNNSPFTAGAVVAGSTVNVGPFAAGDQGTTASGDFAFPTSGMYAIGLTQDAAAGNSTTRTLFSIRLQARNT